MPTPTYTLISETVLGSAQASVTFSSIPGTYKDLVLETTVSYTGISGTQTGYIVAQFNGDTASNYSTTGISGTGSSVSSSRESNSVYVNLFTGFRTTELGTCFMNVMSYANTNVNKTSITRHGVGNGSVSGVSSTIGLWRSLSSITSIKIYDAQNFTFAAGSTFRLWGVLG